MLLVPPLYPLQRTESIARNPYTLYWNNFFYVSAASIEAHGVSDVYSILFGPLSLSAVFLNVFTFCQTLKTNRRGIIYKILQS